MEIIPQQDYCPVEPEAPKPTQSSQEAESNQPMGVVPPNMPNQAEVSAKAEPSSKTSPLLFILVMILLAISSGLGYLIVSGKIEAFTYLLPF